MKNNEVCEKLGIWSSPALVCEKLGICRKTLMKYDRPGITIRIGKCVRYDVDALIDAIKAEQEEKENVQETKEFD